MLKIAIVTFAALISSSIGYAEDVNVPANQVPGTTDPGDELKPVRQVMGRVKIFKQAIVKSPTGVYNFTITPICQKDILINVFDVRSPKPRDWYQYGPLTTCDAELSGKKVEVETAAVVVLRRETVFDHEPESEIRSNTFLLQSRNSSGGNTVHASGSVFTRDLMASAILNAQESNDWKCAEDGTCGPATLETIGGTIEFGP